MSKIERTFIDSTVEVVFYSPEQDKIEHRSHIYPLENITRDSYKLSRADIVPGFVPVYVYDIRYMSTLYRMDESLFIENATKVDKRGPETRGCVTKEVHAFVADCLVFNNETFKVEDKALSIPGNLDKDKAKEKLNRAAKGYTVVNVKAIREEIGLYYMPMHDFVRIADIVELK